MDRAKQTAVIGVNSVKLNKDTIIPGYTLVADSIYCDDDPIKKKAESVRISWSGNRFFATGRVSCHMASEEAAGIIDLYQRKALDWAESRANASLFEKPWLDRFRALLPPAAPILDIGCGSASQWTAI